MSFRKFLVEAYKRGELEGIRFIYGELANTIFQYDEIERADGTGRSRKGTPLSYEIDRFQDEYGIDIEYMKKSDFPMSYDYKTKTTTKIKFIEYDFDLESHIASLYRMKGFPAGYVGVFFWNNNTTMLIHKDDVDKLATLAQDYNTSDSTHLQERLIDEI